VRSFGLVVLTAILCAVLASESGPCAAAPLPPACQALLDDYRAAWAQARGAVERRSLEQLYALAERLSASLTKNVAPADTTSPLEQLTDEEYAGLVAALPTFDFDREIYVMAEPRSDSLWELASDVGLPADSAFFGLRSRTHGGAVPTYVDQTWDYGGCTQFGTGELAAHRAAWMGYRLRYGNRYRVGVARELAAVETELTTGTCACGDSLSVIAEIGAVLRARPSAALGAKLRTRLRDVRAGRAKITYHCRGGG
jgi:hypothetical protein